MNDRKKPKSPLFFIAIGLIYLINPIDFPTPIDDIIVNIIMMGLALRAKKVCAGVDKVIEENTGVRVDSFSAVTQCVENCKGVNVKLPSQVQTCKLEKMEDVFTNVNK